MRELRIITVYNPTNLEERVNEYIKNGWELHGPLFITEPGPYSPRSYNQGVVSKESKP